MKNYTVNGKPLQITEKCFLAEGGEGKIYVVGNLAYKIFHEPKKATPKAKVLELMKLDRPEILGPRAPIEDAQGAIAGFVMPYGKGEPLCKFFTEGFRSQIGFSNADAVDLAAKMQEVLSWIHARNCLVVDYNEHNLLVSADEKPLHIDIGAWQTPTFPATALMENVRDPQVKNLKFSEGSDWFSFAVVATQLYLGIHPYRGRHPDYKPVAWRQMMEKGLSIFNRQVKLPAGVRPFDSIPKGHRVWLESVLEHGERSAPPAVGAIGALTAPVPVASSGKITLTLIGEWPGRIRDVLFYNDTPYVTTTTGVYREKTQLATGAEKRRLFLVPTSAEPTWAEWDPIREIVTLQTDVGVPIPTQTYTVGQGRLWTTNGTYLCEQKLTRLGPKLVLGTRPAGPALPNAKFGDGALVQPMPGGDRFSTLLRSGGIQTLAIPEMKGWKVLAATGRDQILQILGRKGTELQLVTSYLNQTGLVEKTIVEPRADYYVPSLVVTSKGVFARLSENELQIWKDILKPMVIKDPGLAPGARLWANGPDVYASEGSKLYKVRTK